MMIAVGDDTLSVRELRKRGVAALRELFGPEWTIARQTPDSGGDAGADEVLELVSPEGDERAQLLVQLKRSITPRDADRALRRQADLIGRLSSDMSLLVMAPWIAPRTQRMLRDHGIGYVDLTGNVSVRIVRPAVMIYTEGASKQPWGTATRGEPRTALAGSKAGRLVRVLADVAPPYRGAQLAQTAELSLAWVSKLLARLEEQLLIKRDGRVVTEVDWRNLLRARAETFELLKHNEHVGALAPNGVASVRADLKGGNQLLITGSYAARQVAPLAVGGQLMLYVRPEQESLDDVAERLGLLRVDENPDVLLLVPDDEVVFSRSRLVDGVEYVALSQVALDCLAGPGRMPAEGEAVIDYMGETEDVWRLKALSSL